MLIHCTSTGDLLNQSQAKRKPFYLTHISEHGPHRS